MSLNEAVIRNQFAVVKSLLNRGVSPNTTTNLYQNKPLFTSAYASVDADIMKLLLERGASPNAKSLAFENSRGSTALMIVCEELRYYHQSYDRKKVFERQATKVKLLLKYGAKTNYKDNTGYTALHYAIEHCGNLGIIKDLISNGAQVDAKINSNSGTAVLPLDLALSRVVKRDCGVKRDYGDPKNLDIVVYLVSKGASIGNTSVNTLMRVLLEHDLHVEDSSHMRVLERLARALVQKEPSLKILTNFLASLLLKFTSKRNKEHVYSKIVKLFHTKKGPTGSTQTSIVEALFLVHLSPSLSVTYKNETFPTLPYPNNSNKILCPLLPSPRTKNTTAIHLIHFTHPYHVLVVLVTYCHTSNKSFNSSRNLTKIVDHLQKKGFDINTPLSRKVADSINLTQEIYDPVQPAIAFLERTMTRSLGNKDRLKVLRDLHSIFVSRGARTSTGRYHQRVHPGPRSMARYLTKWTTEAYRNVQNARRKPAEHSSPRYNVLKVNRYIAQAMRDHGTRVPVIPRQFTVHWNRTLGSSLYNVRPKYLFRGLHNPLASEFLKTGTLHDAGYMAFSRHLDKAAEFAGTREGVILKLPIDSIPPNTPWLWFTSGKKYNRNVHKSNIEEQEVLLPPGTLQRIPDYYEETGTPFENRYQNDNTNNYNNSKIIDIFRVRFIPDMQATSLKGKRIYRKSKSTGLKKDPKKRKRA